MTDIQDVPKGTYINSWLFEKKGMTCSYSAYINNCIGFSDDYHDI